MSTALEQRIVELETRLAFQEPALAELSDALTAARIAARGWSWAAATCTGPNGWGPPAGGMKGSAAPAPSASADRMANALEQRSGEVETRLAFKEQALAELSDALAAARIEAAGHADLLQRTLEAMKQSRGELYADPSEEPPPPHY